MKKFLKDKKILITAGPVWISLDEVRVITNIFNGILGLIIALEAQRAGAETTLLLGPGRIQIPSKIPLNLKLIRFKYFDEFFDLMKKEVSLNKYDVIIHSAAVSDYEPIKVHEKKIKSGQKNLIIQLKPTLKIVDQIKKWDPSIFLVKFKLEVDSRKKELIHRAYNSMTKSEADLMVANDLKNMSGKHEATIIKKDGTTVECKGKKEIAQKLLYMIKESI